MNRILVMTAFAMIFGGCDGSMKMLRAYGKPTNATGGTQVGVSSFSECVDECYNSIYCVLAYGTESSCTLYDFNNAYTVMQLDETSEVMVALKVNISYCPVLPSQSFSNNYIYDPTYPYTVSNYSVTFANNVWSFKYTVTKSCPSDWTRYTRPTTDYCLKFYGSPSATYTQQQATDYCALQNATLAGLETTAEQDAMTSQGLAINQKDARGLNYSAFWVSGVRRSACTTLAQVATVACSGTRSFTFSDVYLTKIAGYQFAPGNPDGVTEAGAIQNCIMLRTQTNGDTMLGKVDDVQCTYTTGSVFDIHGYICGKIPGI